MNERPTGGPAFPCIEQRGSFSNPNGDQEPLYVRVTGMSMLDYFAARVMEATLTNPELLNVVTGAEILGASFNERVARKAYEIADAMIAARERKGE